MAARYSLDQRRVTWIEAARSRSTRTKDDPAPATLSMSQEGTAKVYSPAMMGKADLSNSYQQERVVRAQAKLAGIASLSLLGERSMEN